MSSEGNPYLGPRPQVSSQSRLTITLPHASGFVVLKWRSTSPACCHLILFRSPGPRYPGTYRESLIKISSLVGCLRPVKFSHSERAPHIFTPGLGCYGFVIAVSPLFPYSLRSHARQTSQPTGLDHGNSRRPASRGEQRPRPRPRSRRRGWSRGSHLSVEEESTHSHVRGVSSFSPTFAASESCNTLLT